MAIGIVGKKCGMTRIFTENGVSIPVSVIEVGPNRITQIKTNEKDGYSAVQVTAGSKKTSRVSKAQAGHFSKANVEAGSMSLEFRLTADEAVKDKELTVQLFSLGQKVDVTATSKGKGFAGTIKRWNFRGQDNSHGNSISHRVPGSIGQCQTPGRVFKGKKMSGHLGAERVTVQSLEIAQIIEAQNLLLVKGSIPGPTGADVIVRPATKVRG